MLAVSVIDTKRLYHKGTMSEGVPEGIYAERYPFRDTSIYPLGIRDRQNQQSSVIASV